MNWLVFLFFFFCVWILNSRLCSCTLYYVNNAAKMLVWDKMAGSRLTWSYWICGLCCCVVFVCVPIHSNVMTRSTVELLWRAFGEKRKSHRKQVEMDLSFPNLKCFYQWIACPIFAVFFSTLRNLYWSKIKFKFFRIFFSRILPMKMFFCFIFLHAPHLFLPMKRVDQHFFLHEKLWEAFHGEKSIDSICQMCVFIKRCLQFVCMFFHNENQRPPFFFLQWKESSPILLVALQSKAFFFFSNKKLNILVWRQHFSPMF